MKEIVYEAIKGWAGISTWHTNHPADKKRFNTAMERLYEKIGGSVSEPDIRYALKRHRGENVELLGGKPSDEAIEEHVEKIMELLFSLDNKAV